jgi:hypothetical protein
VDVGSHAVGLNAFTIRGAVARVEWGYFIAAAIEGYVITRAGKGPSSKWRARATVITHDAFKLSQRPLMFVAPTKHGEWRWPVLTITVTAGRLVADLGAPIE